MINLDTTIPLDFEKFWNWWTSELAFLVPGPLRQIIRRKRNFLVIEKNGDEIQLTRISDGIKQDFGCFGANSTKDPAIGRLIFELQEANDTAAILRLPHHFGLRKVIVLPMAVRENLHKVVEFEMDRQTPFTIDQVYYDVRVIEKLPNSNQIKVEIILILRSKLDQILEEVSSMGLRPNIVDLSCPGENGGVAKPSYNLLPEKLRTKKLDLPKLLNVSLSVLFFLLLVITLVIPIWTKKSYLAELEQEASRVGMIAMEVRGLQKDVDDQLLESGFMIEKKRVVPVIVETLNELTLLIPDHSWLTYLQYKDGSLQIQGQSPAASSLIEVIESSILFKETSFVSPVTQDRRTNLERFQIATQVVNRRRNEQPADSKSG